MGGLALGVPGVAAKPHDDDGWTKVTGREVNQTLEEREVRILLNELGNPPLQRGRGQKTTVEIGASRITRISVPSHVGTLVSSKSDNGDNGALFIFGTPTKKNGRVPLGFLKRLPPKYRDLPAAGEGILILGSNDELVLVGADGGSVAAVPEQETLVDNEEVTIVKSTYQNKTTLIREFKRGPKAGTIQSTEPLSKAEVRGVESDMNRVSAQGISTSDVSTAGVEMPDNFFDVVVRCEEFKRTLDECSVYGDYTHLYTASAFELAKPADLFSKGVLTGVITSLIVTAVPTGGSSVVAGILSLLVGAAISTILALTTGTNYTVGFLDGDFDYYFGKLTAIYEVAANEYKAPAGDTRYIQSIPAAHLGR